VVVHNRIVLEQYYSRLIALERRSPLTVETYRFEMHRFFEWLEEASGTVETVDIQGLSRYLEKRRSTDGIDSRSTAKGISALRSFFRFTVDEHIRRDNPAALLEPPRRGRRLPAVLKREAVDRMLTMVESGSPEGLRNRAIYELIYSAGLRVSEAVSLNVRDIMFSEGIARIWGKGNKERLVVFGGEAAEWLKRYLDEARPLLVGSGNSPALFICRTGTRLSRKGMWKNYAGTAGRAGVSSKLHTLRHSFATELLAGGADLRSVQELLGHRDLGITQIYTHVDVSLLREKYRQYMPKLQEYGAHHERA
jgi:integrase/recombinase XerD